jgi:hypothetical protein
MLAEAMLLGHSGTDKSVLEMFAGEEGTEARIKFAGMSTNEDPGRP